MTDAEHQLAGTLPVVALMRAARHEVVSALLDGTRPAVGAESDLPDIACVMTDFNLMSLPVVDEEGRPIGVLAVDDVLELHAADRLAPALRAGTRVTAAASGHWYG